MTATLRTLAILPALLLVASVTAAITPPPTAPIRAAMRANEFDRAVRLADAALARNAEAPDETLYFRALALLHGSRYDEAVAAAERLLTRHPDSPWRRKARFLQAQAHVQQRNFEPAERIYEEEAFRLLSSARKHEIAGVLIRFADDLSAEPEAHDVGALPPDWARAYSFYQRAAAMEIGRDLRDDVLFKLARAARRAGNPGQAVHHFRAYLADYDPAWTGPVGSVARLRGRQRENPPPAGAHIVEARYELGRSQLQIGDVLAARQNFEDLATLLAETRGADTADLAADVAWHVVLTWRLPATIDGSMERGIAAARAFLATHRTHPDAVECAWLIALTYDQAGRADDAVTAYDDFAALRHHGLPEGAAATAPRAPSGRSPAELQREREQLALFRAGQLRYEQRRYDDAIERWQAYINRYPNGPHWSDAQRRTIEARFMIALDAVADDDRDAARTLLAQFLRMHPLDGRAAQVQFILGQLHATEAERLLEGDAAGPLGPDAAPGEPASRTGARRAYRQAIGEWAKLISKFPGTEESSLARYRTGLILEERLGELDRAIDAYRALTWGSWAGPARQRLALMTSKQLTLRTDRIYRTGETPRVHVDVRNIETLTVRQYFLDPEAYFRKRHVTGGVETLDIALIEPDATFEITVDGYARYRPLAQAIEIPFETGRPGVCIVNVAEDDFEATTLVIRSDLDLAVRSSRREALVYVQDMVRREPARNVQVLLSDGSSVFATGETGDDGVFRGAFDRLAGLGELRVFAVRDGHIASNLVDLAGLTASTGLAAKGYIYTDRPAYLPGQTVSARGIIRTVRDGAYDAPAGEAFDVAIADSQGRVLRQESLTLSRFGTFHISMPLDSTTPVGRYTITASPRSPGRGTYSGHFEVQQFQLEKMELAFEFDRTVYFRGETVKAEILARYRWGEPVVERPVRYQLPDGRVFIEPTDAEGRLLVEFDTSGVTPGRALRFDASIEGENVAASGQVFIPALGFSAAVAPSRELALAGEPFDVTVTTTGPDGRPVGRPMRLFVLRRQAPEPDPVLSQVPWVARPAQASAEVTVEEHELTTDAATGEGTVRLALEQGGEYVLRVAGDDRFDQVVTAEGRIVVSDDEDATRLRFLAERDTLDVGAPARVRLHSRIDRGLALVTIEGETIIEHRVVPIAPGDNTIDLEIDHEHFPNFTLSATALSGRELFTASTPFDVRRELRVAVAPRQDVAAPGGACAVELTVTDQLGRPVSAELSLALVDEALFDLHPDRTPEIKGYFEADARRRAEFRVAASNGFEYAAQTRAVVQAVKDELARLEREAADDLEMSAMREQLGQLRDAESDRAALAAPPSVGGRGGGGLRRLDADGMQAAKALEAGAEIQMLGRKRSSGRGNIFGDPGEAKAAPARRERRDAGWWSPSIVTDARGTALVTIPMPETTSRWRLTARGISVETLAGQATANVITRRDLFVEIKSPAWVVEGDRVAIITRVHNLTKYAGPAELELAVTSGTRRYNELTRRVQLGAGETTEVVFDPFDVPAAGELQVEVSVAAGRERDALVRTIGVRPWGMPYAAHRGGAATGSAAARLELPGGLPYSSRWLTIAVGPSLEQAVIDMALRPGLLRAPAPAGNATGPVPPGSRFPGGDDTGSELLAAASGLDYARQAKAALVDQRALEERIRRSISTLVVTQGGDGGWGWVPAASSDWAISSMSFWALCRARAMGFTVNENTMARAEQFLRGSFQGAASSDHEMRAVILHALSTADAAEFKLANSLYRERNGLEPLALAYTALTLANLDRREIADEVIQVLLSKAGRHTVEGRAVAGWSQTSARNPWLDDEVEVTAISLIALTRVRPGAAEIAPAVEFLLNRRGCHGFRRGGPRGAAVAALARHFQAGRFAKDDYRLTVLVNDAPVRTIERRGDAAPIVMAVPAEQIGDGPVRVRFEMEGRGRYTWAATLQGFAAQFHDPQSWTKPYVNSRRYFHAPLAYRDAPIGVRSTSPVQRLEIGQRTRVHVDLNNRSYPGFLVIEEPLPAGATLVPGSLEGSFVHHEVRDGRIVMYVPRGRSTSDFNYELVGYATGRYRVMPTVIRDAFNPGRMRLGKEHQIDVLGPGERSDDPYVMNDAERFALGTLHFEDGRYGTALTYLWPLFDRESKYNERELARMLLWIHTTDDYFDARRVVQAFELLSVRHPQLTIPFDKILVVGRAYRSLGEIERAWLVFRATIDSSFLTDSNLSAILQDEGQLLGSIDFQESLWWQYPDSTEVASSLFALSQLLYENAARAHELDAPERRVRIAVPGRADDAARPAPSRAAMLAEAIRLLDDFRTFYPTSPLGDDAGFSLASAYLDLEDYEAVVELSEAFRAQYGSSEFASSFQYMTALGHFWKRDYEPALASARVVADGDSRDRDFARYILGQIYHAQEKPGEAITWYRKVKQKYPDALEAIDYFQKKAIALDEVSIVRPGDAVELDLRYRNIASAHLQVYKVDLMKLYLREKNLSRITQVNLAGIEPQLVKTIELGDGRDYADKAHTTNLDLSEEGAYLVICRGEDLFTSGLVLITPLRIEVQEDPGSGRVRVNLVDEVGRMRPAGVHVKAIGSADAGFASGETDLRGVFVADDLRGTVTAIARDEESRYAFYRGTAWLGAPREAAGQARPAMRRQKAPVDYQGNLRQQNDLLQRSYNAGWDQMRRSGQGGVQIEKAR